MYIIQVAINYILTLNPIKKDLLELAINCLIEFNCFIKCCRSLMLISMLKLSVVLVIHLRTVNVSSVNLGQRILLFNKFQTKYVIIYLLKLFHD